MTRALPLPLVAIGALTGVLALSACAAGGFIGVKTPAAQTTAATPETARPAAPVRRPAGRLTPEGFDTSSQVEREAAVTPTASGARLGQTIASLGPPQDQGFWLRTGLVQAEQPGHVVHAATGATVQVTLRPSGGDPAAGSQLSLAAFRVLGVPLSSLPQLQVFAGG